MDERLNKVAALANIAAYDSEATRNYIDGAPHIKHASLRILYANLFKDAGFECNVVRYFSTQSRLFQPIGAAIKVKNTFAIIARNRNFSV